MGLRAARLLRIALAVALLVAGAYASLRALATAVLIRTPLAAGALLPDETPSGQSALAQLTILGGDYAAAIEPARRSLAVRPLHPATLRSLAVSQMETRDGESAARTLTLASQLGWRDVATQTFLLEIALRAGDARAAAIRLDAIARQRPDLVQLKAAMRRLLLVRGGAEALSGRLATYPGWREEYLQATDNLPPALFGPWMAMLGQLKRDGAPPRAAEYSAFERMLLAHGHIGLAVEASRRFGGLGSSEASGFGTIGQGPNASPFAWSIEPGREAAISQALRGSLSAVVDGQTSVELVRRVFPLSAGPHRLTMRIDAAGDDAERGFGWRITCLPAATVLEREATSRAAAGKRTGQINFVAPPGCPAARIALASKAGQVRKGYTVTISDFRLD